MRQDFLSNKYDPIQLAEKVLSCYYPKQDPSFPLNIFKMLRDFGVFYKFAELDDLEGAYSPEGEEYPAAVLLNEKRPFSRQRFTAAHELCHHIKDYNSKMLCPQNSKSDIEKFANKFASSLLMPHPYFIMEAEKLKSTDGYIDPEDAFALCHYFGTSYSAVIWKLYNYGLLSFAPNGKFFERAKVTTKLGHIGKLHFLKNIVDDYEYFPPGKNSYMWLKFKNELVFNDNRLEGLEVESAEVSEMLTDLRIRGEQSRYYELFSCGNRLEVIGHSYIYSYIFDKETYPDRRELLEIHRLLYSLCPQVDEMGRFRKIDNKISGSLISTTHWSEIEQEVYFVAQNIRALFEEKSNLSISEYALRAVMIHHRLTQIHPFEDGNGRVIRAILNWLLKLKNLPPIYIPYEMKNDYIEALTEADSWHTESLERLLLERLLSSFIKLNEEFSLILEEDSDFNKELEKSVFEEQLKKW